MFADADLAVGVTKDELIVGIGEILAVGEIVAVGLIVGGGVGVGGRVGDAVAVGAGVVVDGGAVAGGGDVVARAVGVGAAVGEANAVPVGDGEGDAATSTIAMNELSSSAAGQIASAPARATDLNREGGRRAAGPFRRSGTRFSGRAAFQIPAMDKPLVLVPGCNDPPVVT